jgi:hypothetical protein
MQTEDGLIAPRVLPLLMEFPKAVYIYLTVMAVTSIVSLSLGHLFIPILPIL